jgi:uncharacterized membrane protein (DUF441 family)
MSTFIPLD